MSALVAAAGAASLNRARAIVAVGPTTAAALGTHGVRHDVVAAAPSSDAVAAAIVSYLQPLEVR